MIRAAPGLRRVLSPKSASAFLIVAAVSLGSAAFLAEAHPAWRPWPVLGLWLGSIALLLGGARLLDRGPQRSPAGLRLTRGEVAFLIALTIVAHSARAFALGTVPDTFAGDEAESGNWARSVLAGDSRDPFSTGWAGHPTLWFFLQALSLELFGDTVFGLRMLSALLGTAAVPVLYVVARPAFGRSVASIAAALLAALHFHVQYSRIGVNSVADPLLMLIALGALLSGLRTGSALKLAVAGVAAGVAQHFYLGSRLVPFVLAAVVVHQLLFNRSLAAGATRHLPLALLAFWVAYGPGLRVPLYHWNDFNARLDQVGVFQSGWFDARRALGDSALEILRFQTTQSAGAFTHIADRSVNYDPQMPLLDSVSAVLFVLGIAFSVRMWRHAESAGVLAWLAGTVTAGGILLVDPPQSHRYVTAAPAACILVALAIGRIGWAIITALPQLRRAAPPLMVALVAGLAVWNLNFYFRDYSHRYTYGGLHQGEEITAIGRYLHERGEGSFVYFFGAPWRFFTVGTIRYLAPEVPGVDVHERVRRVDDLPPVSQSTARRPLFLFLPGRVSELSVIRTLYPEGVARIFLSRVDHTPLFFAYEPAFAPRPEP